MLASKNSAIPERQKLDRKLEPPRFNRFCPPIYPAKPPNRNFTRKSDTESICPVCFATLKCATPEFLEIREAVHSKFCRAARPEKPPTRL